MEDDIQDKLYGMNIFVDNRIAPNKILYLAGSVYMARYTWQVIWPPPLWTRHMLGVIEAERYLRRNARHRR